MCEGLHENKHEEVDSDDDDEHDDLGVGAVPSKQQMAMSQVSDCDMCYVY